MNTPSCPDCDGVSRRDFLKASLGAAASITTSGLIVPPTTRAAGAAKSETLVATLYKSFSDAQRKALCFAWDNPLRTEVDNNCKRHPKRLDEPRSIDGRSRIRRRRYATMFMTRLGAAGLAAPWPRLPG